MATVERIRFRLATSHQDAQGVQRMCSRWFHSCLKDKFAQLAARLQARHGLTLSVDRLIVDVGDISVTDFDDKLTERLLAQLEAQLLNLQSRRFASPFGAADASRFDQLLTYLDTGEGSYMEGWRGTPTESRWLLDVFEAGTPVDDPRAALGLRCLQPAAVKRLSAVFPSTVLVEVAKLLAPTGLPVVRSSDGPVWLPLAGLLAVDASMVNGPAQLNSRGRTSGSAFDKKAATSAWVDSLLAESRSPSIIARASAWLDQPSRPHSSDTRMRALSSSQRRKLKDRMSSRGLESTIRHATSSLRRFSDAGLVLLWPFLPNLFQNMGWIVDGDFVDEASRLDAVRCLDWLAWGDVTDGRDVGSPKLLCGISAEVDIVERGVTPEMQDMLQTWLISLFVGLAPISRCGIAELRSFFLQRGGTLLELDNRMSLELDPYAADVMLAAVPWPLSPVVLPWLSGSITVEWGRNE